MPEKTQASNFAWGTGETRHFYELTPDIILDAAERSGIRCNGRCMALNSMENRVFELGIETQTEPDNPSAAFRIAKFYRPGRWTKKQILDEHRFLLDLQAEEIPAIAPLHFATGETVQLLPDHNIWFTIFPRAGGRNPDELSDEQLKIIGRLLARIHIVGSRAQADARIKIDPESYGIQNLDFLYQEEWIEPDFENQYCDLVEEICMLSKPWFEAADCQRIHGDAHLGNLLYGRQGFYWVDFDDMLRGPCVQDIWLLTPGREAESLRQRNVLLQAYEMLKPFDYATLRLVEPLRALRFIHFSAWIAKRWEDPWFPEKFPDFGTRNYWQEQVQDLYECLNIM
ncbi:MAG: serine/threonine protein kinase, partial [Verrucomicrobiota bacterium]